jgi:nitroimidazol reductase NimA-like FMN-containing flavoprotein (pyridoxamine 5'-phosphate oxidase superfamily)
MSTPNRPGDLVPIDRSECLELLVAAPYVRIGFLVHGAPMVLPVNVLWHEDALFLRTSAGSKRHDPRRVEDPQVRQRVEPLSSTCSVSWSRTTSRSSSGSHGLAM